MSELIKKRILIDLTDEIINLDSVSLEIIGHKVIESLEGQTLLHHGINKDYKPVGYTVDTFAQDFRVIAEYSTEDGYFDDSSGKKNENRFKKIENDVSHAISLSGLIQPSRIYLVSNQEEPASFRGKFNQTDLAEQHSQILVFLDSRELAKHIYRLSQDSPRLVDFFCDYLPDFKQNLDCYEYYGRVPPICSNHYSEPGFKLAIDNHFAAGNKICALYGLSGSGKTVAAIDYVNATLDDFGNYIWIAGEDWKDGVPLTAIKRSRGGISINAAGVFNSSKTILVIDDLNRQLAAELFAELGTGFELGGRVLVTSQHGGPDKSIYLEMPTISLDTAFKILGEDEIMASLTARRFVETYRFCPLVISIAREVAASEDIDRDAVYSELVSSPQVAHDHNGESVTERILGRLSEINRGALIKISRSGCKIYDSRFLTKFIGPNARTNLQRLSLLSRSAASSALVVHDLIRSAIWHGKTDGTELAEEVENYISQHRGEMIPSVLRQIHLSADQLFALHRSRGQRKPDWLMYGILQLAEFTGAQELIANLHEVPINASMDISELLCIVDSKEAHAYSLRKQERDAYYRACAKEYAITADLTAHAEASAVMLHHSGKALRRSGQLTKARECFESLISERPMWHATYGQIALIGSQAGANAEDKKAGSAAIKFLFDEITGDLYSVPLRVSLAALTRLRSYPEVKQELENDINKVKLITQVLELSALEGFDQFYEAFVSFTSLFGFSHGRTCIGIAEAFPDMLAVSPEAVDKRQWVNACEALTNIAVAASREGKEDISRKLHISAQLFAESLRNEYSSEAYPMRVAAKAYLAAGKARIAVDIISAVDNFSNNHWLLYLKSKAELELGSNESIASATIALGLARMDSKASSMLAAYCDLLSQCQERFSLIQEAVTSLEEAIQLTGNATYVELLQSRKESLLNAINHHTA